MSTVSLKSSQGRWVIVSTILASSMAFIDSTALNVVLPSLQESLHASGADLFWILNAYLLMLASLILIGGSLGDQLGRKKIFISGIVLFIASSAACGLSPGVRLLVIFRVVQGIGGALMIPGSLALIAATINKDERGRAIGTWSAFTTIVTMGGPILGGFLADAGLWRYIFFINVPIGIAALVMLAFKVTESRDEIIEQPLDFPGAVVVAMGLAMLTFGFLRLPFVGWNSWQVYGSLAVGILLLTSFILIEKKSGNPMMPLGLFKNRMFSGANALTFLLYAGLGAGMLFISLNTVQVQGYSQLQSGLTLLPFTIMMVLVARFAGTIADRYGARWLLVAGPTATGVGLWILSTVKQTAGPSAYWSTFFPGIMVLGLGMSFTVVPLTAAVMGAADEKFSGVASGVNNAMTRIASVFANAIFGAMAVLFFSTALGDQLEGIKLPANQKQLAMEQAANLGNAKVPADLAPAEGTAIRRAYHNSFIYAYSQIMRVCAALAFAGALMALIFIKNVAVKTTSIN